MVLFLLTTGTQIVGSLIFGDVVVKPCFTTNWDSFSAEIVVKKFYLDAEEFNKALISPCFVEFSVTGWLNE